MAPKIARSESDVSSLQHIQSVSVPAPRSLRAPSPSHADSPWSSADADLLEASSDACCSSFSLASLDSADLFDLHYAPEKDLLPESSRYIRGSQLPVDGWFQFCRGCNERTAKTLTIQSRDVPLCHR